ILNNNIVQKDLTLSEGQITKFSRAVEKVRDKYKERGARVRKELLAYEKKVTALHKQMTEANEKSIAQALKPEQHKRLKQIEVQQLGVNAFAREDVLKRLKLTKDQEKEMQAVSSELQEKKAETLRDIGRDPKQLAGAKKKVAALEKEALDKMV